MKIDLKNDFNNKILERGYEYYENGLVENVVIKDNIVTAKVIGTTTYNVSVEVDNGVFINGDCTCPYASEGNYCKHMAALLYKLNEEDIDKDNSFNIKVGAIASGDVFCTDPKLASNIYEEFNASCVEMEGAAIGQICALDNVPFIVIRSISDSPNGNNNIDFDTYLDIASKRGANFLQELLK